MRHICYVSGTRADFGLMKRLLHCIDDSDDMCLSIVATGMHLDDRFGLTIREIESAGFKIASAINVVSAATGAGMAKDISIMLNGIVDTFVKIQPDLILLMGDRGEMLAGAIAALHLNLPIAHVHGGERSGTVDEPIRHAISKMSHFHFVATHSSLERLIRMGENPSNIFLTGAPGLDGILLDASIPRNLLIDSVQFDSTKPISLFIYHPVLQEDNNADVATLIVEQLLNLDVQVIALTPNSDAGSSEVLEVLNHQINHSCFRLITHMPRHVFLSWLAAVNFMIGNSSAGIIEAASFGLPVINVGSRQSLRERSSNIVDVEPQKERLESIIFKVLNSGRVAPNNIYGDGQASNRILKILKSIKLDKHNLTKINAY